MATLNPKVTRRKDNPEAVKEAAAKKKAATETIADAWARIFSQKNDEATMEKLRKVKSEMDAGRLGREPESLEKNKKFSKAEAIRLHAILAEQEREGKIAELVAKTPHNYRLVLNVIELDTMIRKALAEPIIAIDTETTGLDVYVDVIVGISVTIPSEDRHYYVPMTPTEDERVLPHETVLELFRPLVEAAFVGKIYHNAIFDMAMFARHGLTAAGLYWDTQTAMHLLNENEKDVKRGGAGSYQLKDLVTRYLKEPSDTFALLFGKDAKFATIPLDVALVYAAKDTDVTWRLYKYQLHYLEQMPTILNYLREIEIPLIEAVYDMERTGFIIDTEFAREYGKEMKAEIDELEKSLKAQLGDINLNSVQQLKPALETMIFQTLPNLDAKKTLKPLAAEHEIIAELLEYRGLAKMYSTYISVLPELIHPVTGRFHVRMNPNGAKTGRFSSGGTGANMQNQPHKARRLFVAPEGKVIIGADFSAQEVRCVTALTGEPVLVKAFKENRDPYATMAADFFNKPYEDVYKNADGSDTKERKMMKTAYLASLYGTGANTLSKQLKTTPQEAQKFLDKFFKEYSKIAAWIKETQDFLCKNGYVWIGDKQRKRRLPAAKPKAGQKKKNGYDADVEGAKRQGPNARVQGWSAIQTKATIVELHRWVKNKPGWLLWLTVHDEVLVEAPEDFTREDIAEFEDIILNTLQFGDVKNKSDIEVMKRWGDGVPVDKWFEEKSAKQV